MKDLIKKYKKELYSKPSPGYILNKITDEKLTQFARKFPHDSEALWLGAYLADLFITEAIAIGDINKHIKMAEEFAFGLMKKNNISETKAEIILEIITTHHGGKQKHIESKLYKNADCFKFLDPRGVFHIFGAYYKNSKETFKTAIEYTMYKVEEKYNLVDLDKETKDEAQELYDHWKWLFSKMEFKLITPEIYKNGK